MVLAIDIGNTNVVIGGFQENQILFVERVSTNQNATSLELAISIKTILEIYQIQTTEIEGLCSPFHQPRCAQGGRKDRTLSGASGGAGGQNRLTDRH